MSTSVTKTVLTRLAGGVALACLLPVALAAQTASELAPISVEAERPGQSPTGPDKGFVAERTLTGSKTDTPIREIPQSISVVTRDQLDQRAVTNVGEALTYSAGVVAEPFGFDPRFDAPIIRGFSAAQSQYLNGLKLMRGTNDTTSIDPWGLERIEVLRGPSSVLYGQGNPGGMINLVSKRPTWTSFGTAMVEGATFDRYTGAFDFGGPVPGTSEFAYRLTGLARDGNTQATDAKDNRYFIAPAVTWKPNADTTLTVLANVQHDDGSSPVGLPAQYTLYSNLSGVRLPRSTNLGDPNFDHSRNTIASIGYEFEHRFVDNLIFRQNARYLYQTWDYQNLYFASLSGDTANRGASYNDETYGTFTIDNHLQAKFDTGPLSHTVLLGLDVRHHTLDTLSEFGTAPSTNVFAPAYGVAIPKNVWYASKVDGTLMQTGLYAQDQVKLDRWLLTLGVRHDWASAESTTNYPLAGTSAVQDQSDRAFTGRVGLSYLFDNGLAPYVSWATSFQPVIGSDYLGDTYKPSEGEQYEAGVKYQPTWFKGFFTAAVYDLEQTNVLTTQLVGGVSQTVQTGVVHSKGVELSALANLTEGLDLIANYTYTEAEIEVGEYAGNRPANVPKNAANLWLFQTIRTGPLAGFGFGGGIRYVGARWDLDSNANYLPSNILFDAAASYTTGPYKLSLNIANIADEAYVSGCGYFGCYWGNGRTITGRVAYTW
ncbi:TonB-dependent siderophore receptor [Rhodoplanes sp. TEM]|uniref:TonB-dependent siderophore receptor n=1 Tax=Rhodoplanes tepidamans TaxID=200616 RepID=A0ABT5JCJ7_RHOTP|nr:MULTISPECIES: TonB-dependent siderophore receptor [Rhodoplanes]MDC7787393.1 TonB-dependent siderophore receptor [Rhodoplanes tepidamans]MDC7985512.1 TonB-dependent siderophore receptor [Rhodoplanes sp. TEM]MDQ0358121.1 iron complex outermembrane receptor protein [Rhodoplanes tepidamans]